MSYDEEAAESRNGFVGSSIYTEPSVDVRGPITVSDTSSNTSPSFAVMSHPVRDFPCTSSQPHQAARLNDLGIQGCWIPRLVAIIENKRVRGSCCSKTIECSVGGPDTRAARGHTQSFKSHDSWFELWA